MTKSSEKPTQFLMKVDVPLMSRSDCLQQFNNKTMHNETMKNTTTAHDNAKMLKDEDMFWRKSICGGKLGVKLGNSHCACFLGRV